MTEQQLIEAFQDLVREFLHKRGGTVMFGETVETSKGTFDIELSIIEYDND